MNVSKQNELRARQNDVLIQEQANEVLAKQKDLEVQMCMKDNELALKRKIMQNTLRMQEMEIEILLGPPHKTGIFKISAFRPTEKRDIKPYN